MVNIILGVVLIAAAIFLIVAVLMQEGKNEGLSGALSGSSDSYMSKNKKGNLDAMLASSTKWIALAWVLLTLSLSLV